MHLRGVCFVTLIGFSRETFSEPFFCADRTSILATTTMNHPFNTANPFASLDDDVSKELKTKKKMKEKKENGVTKRKSMQDMQEVVDYLAEVGLKHSVPAKDTTLGYYNLSIKILVNNLIGKEVIMRRITPDYYSDRCSEYMLCIDGENHALSSLHEFREFVSDFLQDDGGRCRYKRFLRLKQLEEEEKYELDRQFYVEKAAEDRYYAFVEREHNESWWRGLSIKKQHEELFRHASKGAWRMVDTLLALSAEIPEETRTKIAEWKKELPRK